MATYYPPSSHYLRDSAPNSYPETQGLSGNMMMYMNYNDPLSANPQSQQNCVDLPPAGTQELGSSQQGMLSNFSGSQSGEQGYSFWRDGRNEMMFMQQSGGHNHTNMDSIIGPVNGGVNDLAQSSVGGETHMSLGTQLEILNGGQNLQGQGLSLSLSTQIPSAIPISSFQFRQPNSSLTSFLSSRDDESSQNKQLRNVEYLQPGFGGTHQDLIKEEALNNHISGLGPKQIHSDSSPYGLSGISSTITNSKYLKITQQLLDEVVNVHKVLKQHNSVLKASIEIDEQLKDGSSNPQELTNVSGSELSSSERQELQNKMTKLLSMLDEVDRRYKQYYHQMQIVVSSFDVIAGSGAAKPYTALALQTISRHFRCLKDAINDQINATRKNLGEQDNAGNNKVGGISRLRFVDQQLRQQRAFQQFGMMQQHAWRPQRGLPENSVSVLRAWLFEHFLHPYPKDSDKIMLARQTGLTRSQVSNWFINARVRLWKPMVEEMYKEEFGETEIESNSSSENITKSTNSKAPEDRTEGLQQLVKSATTERFYEPKPDAVPNIESGVSFQNGAHGDETYGGMKLSNAQRSHENDCSFLQDALVQSQGNGNGRFMAANAAYQMAELTRYGGGNGVSLTLGLQHSDDGGLSMSGGPNQNFIMRPDNMYNAAAAAAAAASPLGIDTTDYNCTDPDDQNHRFGSSHMLHDFVA